MLADYFVATTRLRRLMKVLLVVWVSFGAVVAGIAVAIADMAMRRQIDDLTAMIEALAPVPPKNRFTGGAGLGLAIARHLSLAHGGTVHSENGSVSTGNGVEEDRGTRLTVRLPAIDSGTVSS